MRLSADHSFLWRCNHHADPSALPPGPLGSQRWPAMGWAMGWAMAWPVWSGRSSRADVGGGLVRSSEARWSKTMTDDEFRKLLARHLEAENAHRLADTLGTLTSDCLFEDVALGRRFGGHEGAAAYYRMWWDGFERRSARSGTYQPVTHGYEHRTAAIAIRSERRTSREGRDQRSSHCATNVAECERTERRIRAARLSGADSGRRAHISQFWRLSPVAAQHAGRPGFISAVAAGGCGWQLLSTAADVSPRPWSAAVR